MRGTIVVLAACAVTTLGCAGRRGEARDERERPAPPPAAAAPAAPVPSGSPLAKIQMGMSMNEVSDLLGPPTDTHSSLTGKAFIPYYYGDDQAHVEWYYKGVGRVLFSAGGGWGGHAGVMRVEHDPNETGYYRGQ